MGEKVGKSRNLG